MLTRSLRSTYKRKRKMIIGYATATTQGRENDMHMSWKNEITTKFYTVRYRVGKDRALLTEIIEFFVTLQEAHDFVKKDSFSKNPEDYKIGHEPLKVSIQKI